MNDRTLLLNFASTPETGNEPHFRQKYNNIKRRRGRIEIFVTFTAIPLVINSISVLADYLYLKLFSTLHCIFFQLFSISRI